MRLFGLLLALLYLLPLDSWAQLQDEKAYYFLYFKNKAQSTYHLGAPSAFLSERALERRERQGIGVDETDLPVSESYIESLENSGYAVVFSSKWLNGVCIGISQNENIASLRQQFDFIAKSERIKDPLGPGKRQDEHSKLPTHAAAYGDSRLQLAQLNGTFLHQEGYFGTGKWIAVLDAGFFVADKVRGLKHLYEDGRFLGKRDFINPTSDLYSLHTHGTNVLSIMAAFSEGKLIGSAPLANYLLIRTEDVDSEFPIEPYAWVAGAEWADSMGVDILNTSLGYTTFDNAAMDYSYEDLDGKSTPISIAAGMAAEKGMLVVTAAGNYGGDRWQYIGAPADALGGLSVGANDADGERAWFSSRGPAADGRIKPEVMARGERTTHVFATDGDEVFQGNGTSYAAPIIAGLSACLWEAFPEVSADLLRRTIIESSSQYRQPDSLMGFGMPDFRLAYEKLQVSTHSESSLQLIRLFPNPMTHGSIQLDLYTAESQRVEWTLMNATGQVVGEGFLAVTPQFSGRYHIDFPPLPIGAYVLQLSDGNERITRKIINYP